MSSTKVANFHDFCHNFNFHRWKFTPISNQRKGCSGDKKNGSCESCSQYIFSFGSIRRENSPCATWLARDRWVKFSRRKSIKNKLRKFTRRIMRDRQRTTLANQSWVFCLAVSTIVTLWKFTQCVLMRLDVNLPHSHLRSLFWALGYRYQNGIGFWSKVCKIYRDITRIN